VRGREEQNCSWWDSKQKAHTALERTIQAEAEKIRTQKPRDLNGDIFNKTNINKLISRTPHSSEGMNTL